MLPGLSDGAGEQGAEHDEIGTTGEGFDDVAGVTDAAISDDGDACRPGKPPRLPARR
jgi:hypothetical protein